MSGVYIKGMEMPTGCDTCPFEVFGDCYGGKAKFIMDIDEEVAMGVRHKNCPLTPIPDHGRLIDADALRQSIKESIDECHKWAEEVTEGEMYARVSQSLGTFVECSLRIKAAPTIIAADRKDGAE